MKTPTRLQPLQDEGFINSLSWRLMGSKGASVYVVRSGDETRFAKVLVSSPLAWLKRGVGTGIELAARSSDGLRMATETAEF
jgi:hypothetical protein